MPWSSRSTPRARSCCASTVPTQPESVPSSQFNRAPTRRCSGAPLSCWLSCAAWIEALREFALLAPGAGADAAIERGERAVEVRPAIPEYEPVVAQLRDGRQIEGLCEHRIALLARL